MKGFPGDWKVAAEPIIVCGEEHRFATDEQVRASGVAARIVVEPARRDTAPALTLAAALACADGEDAILVAMPADHSIADIPALHARDRRSRRSMRRPAPIATLGMPPTRPDTGFGYIRLGGALDDGAHQIDRFVEKPAAELAAQYVAAGHVLVEQRHFRGARERVARGAGTPAAGDARACVAAVKGGRTDGAYLRPDAAAFGRAPSDSIDYAVMEHVGTPSAPCAGVVVPLVAGWSDLGSWDAVWDAMEKDDIGQRRERPRGVRRRDVELRALGRRAAGRMRRHDQYHRGRDRRRGARRRPLARAGHQGAGRAHQASSMRPKPTRIARCAARGVSTIRSITATASR